MRIFQVLSAASTGGVSSSNIWLRNLRDPLLDLGHDVFLFRAEEGYAARKDAVKRARFSAKLLDAFRAEHAKKPLDLFFAYLMDGMVETAAIDEIRKTGVPMCNFSCNNTHQFDLVCELSQHFDFNLHSEKDAAEKFRVIGATPVWFPMAANPNLYHPYQVERDYAVTFVGQNYARRRYHIGHLLEHGVDVHAFGPGWRLRKGNKILRETLRSAKRVSIALKVQTARAPEVRARQAKELEHFDFGERLRRSFDAHFHSPLSDEDMIRMYSRSAVSLGFLEVFEAHDPSRPVRMHLHLRDFEAPMSGALYLTGDYEELNEFYEVGKEVLTYKDDDELLDKALYFTAHTGEADAVRYAGLKRALKNHTYQQRFTALFQQLGLN